jgi:hypothetical protein
MMKQKTIFVVPLALLGLSLAIFLVGLCSFAFAASESPMSCKEESIARDYLAPLRKLPKVSGFPTSGRLPLGPSRLRIYPPRENLVLAGRSRLRADGSVEGRVPVKKLDWEVLSQLDRMNLRSGRGSLSRLRRQHISSAFDFTNSRFGFSTPKRLGIYRLTVDIKTAHGATAARYQEYFRVVRPRSDLRLTKSFNEIAPGEYGYLRIVNYGTVLANYGFGYQLINSAGESVPTELVADNMAWFLEPGHESHCILFKAPSTAPPGEYQVVLEASDALLPDSHHLTSRISITP